MSSRKGRAQTSLIEWLLEKQNPSARYLTLRDLLARAENDPEVVEAKAAIPASDVVNRIFSKQKPEGHWEEKGSPYQPTYKATYWQLMTLGQLGIDRSDERVQRTCNYIFSLQLPNGGFSSYTAEGAVNEFELEKRKTVAKGKPLPEFDTWAQALVKEHEYSCLTGNVAAALIRLGYGKDPRVKKALDWLLSVQNHDGGWLCPYWKAHIKDKHGCFYGTICPLEALSEVPDVERTSEMQSAIERAAEFLLMHRLYKADHHSFKAIRPSWLKFSFPWFYGYDVLRGLSIVTNLGFVNDERLTDAVKVVVQKRRADGTWLLDSAPIGRMQTNLEPVGRPSKWITLYALRVLKRMEQTSNRKLKRILASA